MLSQTVNLHLNSKPVSGSELKAGSSLSNTRFVVENNSPTQNYILNFYLHVSHSLANEKIEVSLMNEWYVQGINKYYFPSVNIQTDFWKGRCLLGLQGNNLMNRSGLIFANNNDFSISTTEYRILPGRVLGWLEIRF